MTPEQFTIPITIIRGGTSRGIFIKESDLPQDRSLWGPYIIELFGSTSERQINGLGGADPTTSKCCIIGPNSSPDIDITYTFAQVGIGEEKVYWDMNCGNLIASVGTFAILAGYVPAVAPVTTVRVWQANTERIIKIEVPIGDDGQPVVDGPMAMGGVPGTGAPVSIDFSATAGASIDHGLFPTGNRTDIISVPDHGDLEVSILDLANMCVFFRAEDLGFTGYEPVSEGGPVAHEFHKVRIAAQKYLGIEVGGSTPWPVSIAKPLDYPATNGSTVEADSYDVSVRLGGLPSMYDTLHQALPGTAASCASVAAVTAGTVVNRIYTESAGPGREDGIVRFGHPSGVMIIEAGTSEVGGEVIVDRVSSARTVRLIMEGNAYLRHSEIDRLLTTLDANNSTRATVPKALVQSAS
jgi:2-methylaconitate cis-trans-isomerase PrpF